jgi:hypothetical protein
MTQQQLIQRLKQQPKQSSLADLTKDWDAIKGVATSIGSALADLTQYGTQATEAIAQLSATMIKTGEKGFKGLLNESVALQLGMAKVLDVNDTLMTAFKDTAKAATFLERKNSVLNKGFGISSKNSQKLAKELNTLSKSISGNTAESQISTDSMMKYAVSIKTMLPTLKQAGNTSTQFYTGLQQSQHILQASLGLTEEQANAFTQFGAANFENAARQIQFSEQVAKQMGDTDGSMGYLKMITEGIAEAGEEIQLQYGRLPGSLERATIKASRLGLKLEHLSEAGSNLLDIETSIGQELEYQLLTGRQLTDDQGQSLTNLYREATLRGDANKQANILSDIIAEEGETLENNLFARKQMSELLGLQENELAAAIQKQKILEKAGEAGLTINLDDEGAISKAAAALRDQGALSQKEFETFQKQNDTRTTDDLLKEQLLIAEESIIYQKLNAMSMRDELFKAAQEMSAAVGQNAEMSEEQLQALGKAFTVLQVPRQTAQEIKQSATAGTITPRYDKQNDVMIPPGYGNKIISAGEDTFALNNDDTIVAGTNLFPKQSSGNSSLAAKMDELISEIRTQTRVLSKRDNTFGAGINSAYYG